MYRGIVQAGSIYIYKVAVHVRLGGSAYFDRSYQSSDIGPTWSLPEAEYISSLLVFCYISNYITCSHWHWQYITFGNMFRCKLNVNNNHLHLLHASICTVNIATFWANIIDFPAILTRENCYVSFCA